jgi:hexokinase
MAINCEWGAFDNEHLVLPRTNYDVEIDRDSPRPGQQAFEKMIAGYYLGEVFRLVLLDLHAQNLIFEGKSLTKLSEPYSLDTSVLAEIESDPFENLIETGDMFIQKFGLECTEPELRLIRRLAELIGLRAARLSACGVAAIAKKKNIQVNPLLIVTNNSPVQWEQMGRCLRNTLTLGHGYKTHWLRFLVQKGAKPS